METILKGKILRIREGEKFFDLLEEMESEGKKKGTVKLKGGEKQCFIYIASEIRDGKKIHYIEI